MGHPKEPKRVWHYWMDVEGHLWHEGAEFDDPQLLHFFMKNMEQLPDGRVRVLCQGEECFIESEDVPYVVQGFELKGANIELCFSGAYQELLDPTTLRVGAKNVLYCKVRSGKFNARFNRKAYLDFTKLVHQDPASKEFYLILDKKKYPIKGVT